MDDDEYALICSLAAYPSSLRPASNTTATAQRSSVIGGTYDAGSGSSQPPLQLSVSEETFAVIKRQVEHRRFRAALRLHRQDKTLKRYITRHGQLDVTGSAAAAATDYAKGKKQTRETMYEIATSVDFSPCMMARVLLEAKYGWSKATISNFFKEAFNEGDEDGGGTRKEPNRRGLSEREYSQLLLEVRECIDRDKYCSPLADRIRHNMGVEYEYLLLEKLRNRKLVYESEDVLREKGLSKTPDVRLLLPMGVRDSHGVLRVVNWIDSKAMFGDRHTHESENAGQLQGYVNRYGPGMVIYWFGHVANLSTDSDVVITHEFPSDIVLPGGLDPLENVVRPREHAVLELRTLPVETTFDTEWTPISTVSM
uniref:CDAN1-interacting nuclease 1 n=1 Tax=Globisporangium ultimum (strain ATCC 200006 / CBS 805.95 / DAOM BR144) TaxID=431595 RepID=K3WE22_GLOUD